LIKASAFDSLFENPTTGKFVRIEFVEKVKQSEHWQHRTMVPNLLAKCADIWK
jgi:hypothetical protein